MIEQTVTGMGYEVVELEFAAAGLIRVFIDFPWQPEPAEQAEQPENHTGKQVPDRLIAVEDCEKVSHQLGHVLMVEEIDYERLEVSSPGVDRPLITEAHFHRFAGQEVSIELRELFEGRKRFSGVLTVEENDQFGLELIAEQAKASGARKRPTRQRAEQSSGGDQWAGRKLVFSLNEIVRARLVPKVDFRRQA
ncbi:MAG: ribosome maturation factor RimP [Burkholderiaceae bacterium]